MEVRSDNKDFDLSSLSVVILAGGLGTRLISAVPDAPKALAPICGRPFIFYLLAQLRSFGINRVILSTGFRAEQIRAACGNKSEGMEISYSREIEPLGTGGAIGLALSGEVSQTILVLNGDSYCEFDFPAFLNSHRSNNSNLSILLTRQEDTSRYGRVEIGESGAVLSFLEKSEGQGPGWINGGIYLLSRNVVDSIPQGVAVSLEREIFPQWIGNGMCGFKNKSDTFIDIGTPESFQQAQQFFSKK